MSLQPPRIPDYSFPEQALIGEGAYGWVWLGLFKGDQPRAVKVFKPRAIQEELWRGEHEKLRALDEPPGIVTLYDAGHTDEGQPFVAMRLMADRLPQGAGWQERSLAKLLQNGVLPMSEGMRLLREIAETLAFMHHNQVRHCDLKPGNILLTKGAEPRPVLCDFGQSRRVGDADDSNLAPGTAIYAPPEQLRNPDQPDKSWDVYSFGVTAYRVLTGELPRLSSLLGSKSAESQRLSPADLEQTLVSQRSFDSDLADGLHPVLPSPTEIADQIEREAAGNALARPQGLTPELSDTFDVIERCLQLDGGQPARYRDMEEVQSAVLGAARLRLIAVERRKKLVFVALTVFGLTAAAIAGWKGWTAERAKAETDGALVKMAAARIQSEESRIAELEARKRAEASKVEADLLRRAADSEAMRAGNSERRALQSEELAQHARLTAEQLINRMLYDLRAELETVGRVDLLDEVSRYAEHYFANLPQAFRTGFSERERSTMLNNRGDVILAVGDAEAALDRYRDGLILRRRRLAQSENDPARRRDLTVSLERVGDALLQLGRYEDAEKAYQECLEIRRLGVDSTEDKSGIQDMCVALVKMGDLHEVEGDLEAAEDCYSEALERLRDLVKVDDRADHRRDLCAALTRIADHFRQTDRGEEAVSSYRESLQGLRTLQEEQPLDWSILRDIGAVSARLGEQLMAAGEAVLARQALDESCGVLEKLVERDPQQISWQRSLAAVQSKAGDVAEGSDIDGAEKYYQAAAERYEILIGTQSSAVDDTLSLAVTHYKLAALSRREGLVEKSIKHYDEAIDLLIQLRDDGKLDSEKEEWIGVLEKERDELR